MRLMIYIILAGIIVIVIVVFVFYRYKSSPGPEKEYKDSINLQRTDKENYFRNDPNSPFNLMGVRFDSLRYFDIDPDFKVSASIVLFPLQEKISMPMNDGTLELFTKYASLEFTLKGQPQHLILYKSESNSPSNIYFLPFFDETSSIETYGGGRFLDPEYNEGKEINVDFNLAYNPYCAYVAGYVCPLPPSENKITVAVTSGEKNYKTQ